MADETSAVDVFELARTGGTISGVLPLDRLARVASSVCGGGDFTFRFEGRLDDRRRPAARLRVSGSVALICDRCGAPVEVPLELNGDFWFVRSEEELNRLPIDDGVAEPLLGSNRFPLPELIEDEILLALPMMPRHASCTAGEGAKFDAEDERRRPFAALGELKARH